MKTRTEQISIPYRHGILHGRDLGYANAIVAAKCWSMLFATGEWATDVEEGRRVAPPPSPPPSLGALAKDLTRSIEKQRLWKERIATWAPRRISIDNGLLESGPVESYPLSSPERALVAFIHHWAKRNYGEMAKLVDAASIHAGVRPKRIRQEFAPCRIRGELRLVAISDRAPSVVDIEIVLDDTPVDVLVMFVDDEGTTQLRDGLDGGRWRIVNWASIAARMSTVLQDESASGGVGDR